MTNQIEEITQQFIEKNNINFRSGKKETFFADVKRSLQPIPGGKFRTQQGAAIADPESYLQAMLETGLYTFSKPSTAAKYISPFPTRSDSVKSANKKLTESFLKKAFEAENYVFLREVESKIIDMISGNFLPADGDDGIEFRKINDTVVGSFFGKQSFTVESLLNALDIAKYIDKDATRIAQLSHKAQLRQTAMSMAESGSKPAAIEKIVEELASFEKRTLKVGRKVPYQNMVAIEAEYNKRAQLNGDDRHTSLMGSRTFLNSIDDITAIRNEAAKIPVPSDSSDYTFND